MSNLPDSETTGAGDGSLKRAGYVLPLDLEAPVAGRTLGGGERVVQIAAKLYRARDAMRGFWSERYAEKITEYQGYIRKVSDVHKCDEMKATMKLVERLQKDLPDSGMTQALVLAAYVEMIEPSEGLGAVGDSAPHRERKGHNVQAERP